MADFSGLAIGRYIVQDRLGQGGMATVYRALDTRLDSEVAIKFIRREAFPPEAWQRILLRFEREARVLARLNHLNIVSITDYGEHDGVPYLVMRYIPGGTLKDRQGRMHTAGEVARLLLPVANALAYAHDHSVLHRDIKPGNILLTETGEPVLGDFGIARLVEDVEGQTLTGTGMGIGTPEYMSPEQGLGKEIDARTDVYSLGIVFYELVTGKKPFTASTPMEVVFKHVNDPLPDPRSYNPQLSDHSVQLVTRALAKKPEQRFASMHEMANALAELIISPVGPVEPTVSAATVIEPKKQEQQLRTSLFLNPRARWAVSIVVLVGLLVIAGIGWLVWGKPTGKLMPIVPVEVAGLNMTATALGNEQMAAPRLTDTPQPILTPTPWIISTMISPIDQKVMVYVPAGEFLMGSTDADPLAEDDEKPQHTVALDAFWIDQTEVTNGEYARCDAAGSCRAPARTSSDTRGFYYGNPQYANHPVIYVSWQDASDYCAWAGKRLPTEAEWEKAARGTSGRIYPWGDGAPDCQLANKSGCVGDTSAVGSYPAGSSPYGALDMAGNVWEWVSDWYQSDYYSVSPSNNPQGPAAYTYRVLRGGSWYFIEHNLHMANRNDNIPGIRYYYIGFRCAATSGK